jgi:hypothetical protein
MDDKRTIAWFSAFVVVVLLAGVASGILLDRFLLRPAPARMGRQVQGGPMAGNPGRMGPGMRQGPFGADGARGGGRGLGPEALADRLARDLELTSAQKEKVAAVLVRRRAKLDEIRGEMSGRMQKEQADVRAEIRALLDEKQQKRFDEVVAISPGLGGWPGGPGMGGRPAGPGMGRGR